MHLLFSPLSLLRRTSSLYNACDSHQPKYEQDPTDFICGLCNRSSYQSSTAQSGFKTYDSRNSILRYSPTHAVPIRPCWFKLTSRTIFKFRSNFGETSYVYGLRRNKHWIVDQIATCDLLILVLYIWQVIILIWLHILCSISIYFEQVRFFFFCLSCLIGNFVSSYSYQAIWLFMSSKNLFLINGKFRKFGFLRSLIKSYLL